MRVLHRTRCVKDLSESDEAFICDAINVNWQEDMLGHICPPDCPLGCNGSYAAARQAVTTALLLAIGNGVPVTLLYRW